METYYPRIVSAQLGCHVPCNPVRYENGSEGHGRCCYRLLEAGLASVYVIDVNTKRTLLRVPGLTCHERDERGAVH